MQSTSTPKPRILSDFLVRGADTHADRIWCVGRNGETRWTRSYRDLAEGVAHRAGSLRAAGVGRGDRVLLIAENSAPWIESYLAISWAGAVVVPVDVLMSAEEIAEVMRRSSPRLALISQPLAEQLLPGLREGAGCEFYGLTEAVGQGVSSLPRGAAVAAEQVSPEDTAVLIFTSGTTGSSKAVVLTHRNLVSNALACLERIEVRHDDVFYLLLPLHHSFSATANMLASLAAGASVAAATSYKSRDIVDDVRVCGVSLLIAVPQVFENIRLGMLRKVEQATVVRRILFRLLFALSRRGIVDGRKVFAGMRKKAGLASLRLLVSGGAALPEEVNHFFNALGLPLIQGYGLTETSPVLTVNPPPRNVVGSVGPALPGVEIRIDDPDPDGTGEICARGDAIMAGYFEDQAATAQVLYDGWFHTGDAGRMDPDGYLYITGRIKNLIVTHAGKNVYPEEIEARLNMSPWVLESLVYGRQDAGGEEIRAWIVPDREFIEGRTAVGEPVDVAAELARVVAEYNHSVAAYRRIKRYEVRDEPFEKSSTRKIRRFLYTKQK